MKRLNVLVHVQMPQWFNLFIREHFISSKFIIVISDSKFFLNCFFDSSSATSLNHAWSCSAKLNVIFANWDTLVHGVKGGDFIDSDWWNLKCFGNFVHDRKWQPTAILTLGQIQYWHNGSIVFVTNWVLIFNSLNSFKIFWGPFEWNIFV